MPDDIARWKRELAQLQVALNELAAEADEMAEQENMERLKKQIDEMDQHIRRLEKRRT